VVVQALVVDELAYNLKCKCTHGELGWTLKLQTRPILLSREWKDES